MRDGLPTREADLVEALLARDQPRLKVIKEQRDRYRQRYACAVPTGEALLTLSRFAPLIEIGAGTGYWAWMLRQVGTDIIAYDQWPPQVDSDDNRFHVRAKCWTEVLQDDERAIDRHPERNLFLCWPPPSSPMAFQALERYRRDTFIFVGEAPRAGSVNSSGDSSFVQLLDAQWSCVQTVALPNWELCWDQLHVFRRNTTGTIIP
jgi:hypothetical protein